MKSLTLYLLLILTGCPAAKVARRPAGTADRALQTRAGFSTTYNGDPALPALRRLLGEMFPGVIKEQTDAE